MGNSTCDLISVIVPVYNAEKYILETINSIISQTYDNLEIILIDDCSTDDSLKILEQVKDPRIRIIKLKENKGVANARNIGIEKSNGEFIAFIDSDDTWEKNKLEVQINFLNKLKSDLCYSGYRIVNSNNEVIKDKIEIPFKTSYSKLLTTNVIACSTVMIRKSAIKKCKFKKIKHEDYIMWLELAKKNVSMIGLNKVLMNYRKHNTSISSNKLKSATWVWNIYRNVEKLPFIKCVYYEFTYMIKGVIKHYF